MYDMPSPYGMNININPANQMFLPRVTVREVEGEQGARNVQMGPNSSEVFIDKTANRVWLVVTDDKCNKTSVSGFTIAPYVPEPEPDMHDIMRRLAKIEEALNGKSDAGHIVADAEPASAATA